MARLTCSQCLRPLSVCYCGQIRRQDNRWPIHILQDIHEAKHAIGTARIAALSLEQCLMDEVDPEQVTQNFEHLQASSPVLIYPAQNAKPVTDLLTLSPRPLIFLDASWRRSRRMMFSMPWLQELPAYLLNPAAESRYRIRKQPQSEALSTLEAIVSCLQTLEHDPSRFDSLLATMDWMIEQQISHMGNETWLNNYRSKE